jgi:hypothetical protein
VVAILCIGLQVEGIKPVQALMKLPTGTFQGTFKLTAHLYTQKHFSGTSMTADTDLFDYWDIFDAITLRVYSPSDGLLMPSGNRLSVDVKQFSANYITDGGKDCTWSDNLSGQGNFVPVRMAPLVSGGYYSNYNPGKETFDVSLTWAKMRAWYSVSGRSHGSIPGCTAYWGPGLAKVEKEAMDMVTKNITTLTFTITSMGTESIGGICDLPKWKGKISIPDGTADRVVDSCTWKVYLVKSKGSGKK